MMLEAADRSFEMTHEIAQQEEVKQFICSGNRREEYITTATTIKKTISMTSPATEEKLLGVTASPTVPLAATACIAGNHGLRETRPARRRRHRRGRTLHRHRLSKHRRDQRARCLKRVIGAPRNNNEFLMSQYDEGLILQEAPISNPKPVHQFDSENERLFYTCLTSALVTGGTDGNLTCSFLTPTRASPSSCGSSPSDYSSLPSSPDEDSGCHGYKDIFFASCGCEQPERTDEEETGCAGVIMDGTDADFLRRNFEEEYANNITRGLEEASKEELVSKCMVLMERLRHLEHGEVTRIARDHVRRSELLPC
ncbi:uncharacterized protein LOC119726652 [Patiria miniata]|uniref:Uncharacterized protein n=1 Tax=Patiria miniata TaxID=46514 RepID=A0A913ZRF1_PATMI|nr:uncharacterized protein LOC119726652 [Patiria miniata]XP_038054343.1 uncharacterized protein LOC119726652 [Patiria miniata]